MKFLLWFGMSQTGKSSSIKLLTGDNSVRCGVYGEGSSTTSEVKVYKDITPKLSQRYNFIDTIGLGDNRLTYNDYQIRNHIEKEIIRLAQQNNVSSIDAIVVTESLKSDVLSLPLIFQQIKNILGTFPSSSIVILGTKKNDCNPVFASKRTALIHQTMKKFGIPVNKYLEFYTPCPDIQFHQSAINKSQYSALQNLLNICPPIQLQSITKKQQEITTRANQIQKEKTTIKVQKDTKDEVRYKNQKQSKIISVPYQTRAGGLRGLLGGTNTRVKQQTIYIDVQVPYTVKIPIERKVPVVPAFDYCYHLALSEFEKRFTIPLAKLK